MQLGDLPPELHSLIANHVCQTGSSCTNEVEDTFTRLSILSLEQVSKYWLAIAQLYKYRVLKVSVAPANAEGAESAVTRLLHRLDSLPAHKRRTHHLQLSEPSHPTLEPSEIDYTQTLPQLISLLSPTLHSLTLSFPTSTYSTSLIATTYTIHFSHLTHLHIAGFYPPPRLCTSLALADPQADSQAPQPETNFPALAHLHLSGVRNPSGILLACPLHLIFPSLRTLEIGGVSGAPLFAHDVACVVAAHGHGHEHDAFLSSPSPPEDLPVSNSRETLWVRPDTHRRSNIPATLTRLRISTLAPSTATPQGPNKFPSPYPSHYLSQRHAKMLGILKSLEHRPTPRDGQRPRVEVNVVEDAVQRVS